MYNKIDISVIIPVYNVEKYLAEALESVVTQTKERFEVIIVNDGSTDSSYEIIKKYSDLYDYIKVINQENKGLSGARNSGLEIAQGEYIYFFDSDDLLANNALEIMYREAKNDNLDVLMFSGDIFYDSQYIDRIDSNFHYEKKMKYNGIAKGLEILHLLMVNNEYTPSACLYLVNRKLFSEHNLSFYEGILHEDLLFTLKLLIKSKKVKIINEVLFYRRVREGSIMTSRNYHNSFDSLYIIMNEMNSMIKEYNINDSKIHYVLNEQISNVYGNLLRNYIKLEKIQKKFRSIEINNIKVIGKEFNFFERKDYLLFYYSEKMYSILRNLFDNLKPISDYKTKR